MIKDLVNKLKEIENVLEKILEKVETRHPRAFIELHELVDNSYWVGYKRCIQDILEFIKEMEK